MNRDNLDGGLAEASRPKASKMAILASTHGGSYVRMEAALVYKNFHTGKFLLDCLARRPKAESIRDAISESKAAAVWIMLVHAGR